MVTALLAIKSLRNRLLTTALTVASIALSVSLLVGIENVRAGMRESFSQTISQTDLIVGSRGGSVQLLLYSVFGMGSATSSVKWETYERIGRHPAVAWAIPYALGDSHLGYRVIGTTDAFFDHYRYRDARPIELAQGRRPAGDREVAIGSEVARRLGYSPGDYVELSHGMGAVSFVTHDQHPFEVVGVLERTFTPVDRALYVTLEGVEAMHEGFDGAGVPNFGFGAAAGSSPAFGSPSGAQPAPSPPGSAAPAEAAGAATPSLSGGLRGERSAAGPDSPPRVEGDPTREAGVSGGSAGDPPIEAITAFFIGTRSRIDALQLQREINTHEDDPLTAILPGVALAEMWRTVGYAEEALRIVTGFVVVVGLLGMIVSLYTSLNERRREMAILRAVGAHRRRILSLLVLESGLLAILGSVIGVGLVYAILFLAQGPVERSFGLHLPIRALGATELRYIGAVIGAGFVLGLIPGLKAYRNTLLDGLSIRV